MTVSGTLTSMEPSDPPTEATVRLTSVEAGFLALEGRLSEAEERGVPPEDRAMLVAMVLSMEDSLRELERLEDPTRPASGSAQRLAVLRTHLDELADRVLVLSGGGRRSERHARLGRLIPRRRRAAAGRPSVRARPAEQAAPLAPQGTSATILRAARVLTTVGLVVASFLAYEFLLTGLLQERSQRALLAGFQRDIATGALGSPTRAVVEGLPVAILDIPRLGLRDVVIEGSSPEDLKAGPGHLRASPLPGEFGNAVIAGRRTTYGAPFRQLARLRTGDPVTVTTGQGSFSYVVARVGRVRAGEPDPLAGTLDSRLTLVTSDPTFMATGRLAVVATLQGDPIAVPNRPPVLIGTGDLGLAGDPLGLGLALIWAQVLALTVWGARRLFARWPRTVRFLFTTPVVLALVMLAFSSLDRVLPGTL